MFLGYPPNIFEYFGPRRVQKVNSLPVEAPLALSLWRFCIFDENGSFRFVCPSVGYLQHIVES